MNDKPYDNPKPAPSSTGPVPGQILYDKYKVVREIGRGGMGIVFEVENIFLGKRLAFKMMSAEMASSNAVRRFQQEAKVLSDLEHPNLVRALDFGLLDEVRPFIIMELVQGTTLADYIKENGRLSIQEVKEIFVPILSALEFAHSKGVVHRDLKPGNIMLVKGDGDHQSYLPKILDFGIAKHTQSAMEAVTKTGELIGTPLYMSPEQCNGEEISNRSDIYSLGCVMFEALTGCPPFDGRTSLETMMHQTIKTLPTLKEASLGIDFPAGVEQVVQKMLQKKPARRFESCQNVIDAMKAASFDGADLAEQPQANSQTESTSKGVKARKLPKSAIAVIAAAVCLVGAAGVYYWQQCSVAQLHQAKQDSAKTQTVVNAGAVLPNVELAQGASSRDDSSSSSSSSIDQTDPLSREVLGLAGSDNSGREPVSSAISDGPLLEKNASDRVFNFSRANRSLGRLLWDGKSDRTTRKIVVPEKAKLLLELDCPKAATTASLALLQTANFFGVLVTPNTEWNLYPPEPANLALSLNIIPATLKMLAFRHVGSLYIESSMQQIQRFPNLMWFSLNQKYDPDPAKSKDITELQAKELAKMKSLPNLQCLQLAHTKHYEPFLEALAKLGVKSKLTRLSLCDTFLTESDCRQIGKFQTLTTLNLCDSLNYIDTNRAIKDLSTLRNLRSLYIDCENINPVTVKVISAMKLKTLIVRNSDKWRPNMKHEIEQTGCQIIETTDPEYGFNPWHENIDNDLRD